MVSRYVDKSGLLDLFKRPRGTGPIMSHGIEEELMLLFLIIQ